MFDSLPETIRLGLARLLLVIVAFSVIWLVRSGIAWVLTQPLQRLLDRTGQAGSDRTIRRLIYMPVSYLLLALAIDLGARILEVDANGMTFVINVTRTLVILAVALAVYRLVDLLIFSRRQFFVLTGLAIDERLVPFVRTGIQLLVVALMIVIVIQEWGYDVTGLIAGLGLGGLAISLAAQDTLSNIFGFAAIVSDRPFVVGEYIKTKDVEGTIERVGFRSTRVRQLDQAIVTMPNSLLAAAPILNWSRLAKRRIDLNLGITYSARPDEIEELLQRLRTLLRERETVDTDSVVVYLIEFGQSSLNILVRCYVKFSDWVEFTAEKERILLEIMRIMEGLNLQIAFPSQSVYIEKSGSSANRADESQVMSDGESVIQSPSRDERG